jgi:hypothetical protein
MADDTDSRPVFKLPESTGTDMSYARFEEIRKADKDGNPLAISEAERAEYAEAWASMRETMDQFRDAFSSPYKSMMQTLSGIATPRWGGTASPLADLPRNSAVEANRRSAEYVASYSGISQETLDGIAEVKQQELEREERNSETIEVTAEVMRDMLATMHAQAVAAEERDEEAKKAAARNYWVAFGSLVFAVLAVIAPFVIEAIKGWD